MLTFADSAWHVLSGSIVFLLGLWFALAQKSVFAVGHKRAVLYYLWHTLFCLFYFCYSLSSAADSTTYYISSLASNLSFSFGTEGVNYLTSFFSVSLGLSYWGTFLVFNIFGYVGMLAFASALQELTPVVGALMRSRTLLLVFLPGLSFWSSAIGKDALTFMAAGLATWGVLNLACRYPALVISSLLYLLARPHMAGIFLASLALSLLFASRIDLGRKVLLLLLAVPSAAVALVFGVQYAGLTDLTSLANVNEYFSERQGYNLDGGSSVDLEAMSLPARLLSYLYRPFFFDSPGIMGFAVSLENLIIGLVSLLAAWYVFKGHKTTLSAFAWIFYLSFSIATLFFLASTTANLGIAIRQKWMFLPMLLALAVSVIFPRQLRR